MTNDPDTVFTFARDLVLTEYEEKLERSRRQSLLYQENAEVAKRLEEEAVKAAKAGKHELAQSFATASGRYRPRTTINESRF